MYVIIVGMLVLLCVSVVQLVYNYRGGANPVQLPTIMQKSIQTNIKADIHEVLVDAISGLCGILLIVAYPLTYILACINAVVFKQYLYVKHVTIPAIKDYLKH